MINLRDSVFELPRIHPFGKALKIEWGLFVRNLFRKCNGKLRNQIFTREIWIKTSWVEKQRPVGWLIEIVPRDPSRHRLHRKHDLWITLHLSGLHCCCSKMKGGLPACCLQTDGPLVALNSCIEMDGHERLQSIREGVLGSGAVFARGFRGLTPKNRLWSCTVILGGNDCSQLSCIGWFSWPGLHEHGPGQQTWLADQIALPCLGFSLFCQNNLTIARLS